MRNPLLLSTVMTLYTLSAASFLAAQSPQSNLQTESDEYTSYELLGPDTNSFKITYEVTATTPGAKYFYNSIRKGSTASGEAAFDVMTGEPLRFEVVPGVDARKDPLMHDADAATNYIKVTLARPVPANGSRSTPGSRTAPGKPPIHARRWMIFANGDAGRDCGCGRADEWRCGGQRIYCKHFANRCWH